MPERINVNGVVTEAEAALVSPLDRGFLYGDSVYETIRTYGGRPFLLQPHLLRLRRSAERLEIDIDSAVVDIEREVHRTLDEAGNAESAIRIVLTRGRGPIGYSPVGCGPPTVIIHARPCPEIPAAWRREGVDVAVVGVTRNAPASLDPAIKSSNLLNNFLAAREAQRLGAYEPLLLNADGRLTEGSTSNVFVVRSDRLLTPPLADGLLEGITRGLVLELARDDGIETSEETLSQDDLRTADEAFLTSTLKGVLPIRRSDGWPIRHGRPGPITERVMNRFEARVQEETKTGSAPGSIRR